MDDGSSTGTPRWVKVLGIVALVLGLLIAASLLLGVKHGPGRHGLPRQASPAVGSVQP